MTTEIRLVTLDDAPQILDIYAPVVRETPTSFEYVVPEIQDIEGRITKTLQQYPWMVCEIDGQIAGYAYASTFRSRTAYQWTTEVTAYVHPNYHRRGLGRSLYTSLFAILREQGYFNAMSVITLPNDASVGLHETMGFEKIGVFMNMGYKLEGWHSTGWWQLELRPMPINPSPPLSITDLATQPDFPDLLSSGHHHIRNN
jgi:L-amino acid N-acyltransferase YncA